MYQELGEATLREIFAQSNLVFNEKASSDDDGISEKDSSSSSSFSSNDNDEDCSNDGSSD